MIDVNIKGLLFGVAAVLPIMQKQKRGHIINMSSVGGFKVWGPRRGRIQRNQIRCPRYNRGPRMELKADNIRCTIISPGAVATELPEGSSEERHQKEFARVLENSSSGRLNRSRDRLRHRATSRGGRQRDRHPAHKAGLLADE